MPDLDSAALVMPRILGLDVGKRRIGVAVTDALGFGAQPLLTLGGGNPKAALKDLGRLVRKHGVQAIVVGNPLHLSGEPSPQSAAAQVFAAKVREALALPVYLQDERLSSHAADEWMDRLGLSRGLERKAKLDQYAAAVILQDWLDGQARHSTPTPDAPLY